VLDDGTHQAVERVIGNQKILELVEADNRELAVGVVQCPGHIKQLEQGGTGLVCRWARGLRSYAHADSGNRGADSQARRPAANAVSRIVRQGAVGSSEPRRRVAERRDLREVNAHCPMAGLAHGEDVGVQQAALAEAAWCREANRDPISRCALQGIELRTAVDQM
jgi:hypothetical protein